MRTTTMIRWTTPLFLALFTAAPALSALAPRPLQEEEQKGEEAEDADADPDEETDRWLVVRNAEVHTGTGAVLRGATVVAKNGKIRAIGYEPFFPEDAEVVDASGLRVYPGLVAYSSSGLLGSGDAEDGLDPFNYRMVLALAGGITTTGQGNAAAKLKRFSIDGALLNDKAFVTLTYSNRNPSSKSSLREKFQRATEYLREYRVWEQKVKQDKELKEPRKSGVDSSVLSVLRGEARAKFNATDRYDLLEIARLAQQYGFRPVIEGAHEGWTVADELGRAGAMAVVTPRMRRSKDERLVTEGGSSIENAALLHDAGVPVAIVPQSRGIDLGGIVGRDIMHLPIEAGFAIRGGLPSGAALEAITIVPARMLGIDHRVGSLEEGKDCDLIVTDGDLFHYETFVQYAVVDGNVVYDKQDELYYAHIRPRPESALAPAEKTDKGEEVEDAPAEEGSEPDEGEGEGEGEEGSGEGESGSEG